MKFAKFQPKKTCRQSIVVPQSIFGALFVFALASFTGPTNVLAQNSVPNPLAQDPANQASQSPNAPPGPANSYLEAAGAQVPINQVVDTGADRNPMLNEGRPQGQQAQQGGGQATGQSNGQPLPPAQLQGFQGNINHSTNVPSPGSAMPSQAPGQQQQQQPQQPGVQQQGQAQQQDQSGNRPGVVPAGYTGNGNAVADAQALPSPKLDIKKEVLNRMAPANPEQLREISGELYNRQAAAVTPARNGSVGRASQYVVDLSPGATPPVIRVARGMGATVNFVDSAGNPWPITFANNFYAEAATVTQMAPHVLSVASNSPHLSGSVGVMLQGLTTPINFVITPAQAENDYRVDLHIPGLSPEAAPVPGRASGSSRPAIASDDLMGFMYGQTPGGATRLQVSIPGSAQNTTRAWQNARGRLIVRTSALIQSPGWYQRLPALDGTAVYELPPTAVVRVSVDGTTQSMIIKGLVPTSNQTAQSRSGPDAPRLEVR